jgi:hypothetical protein
LGVTPGRVDLRIEELVLHGFGPGDRYRIAEAMERELVRLLAEHGVPPSLSTGGDVARIDGGEFDVSPGMQPATVGSRVAHALFRGLSR